MSEYPIEGRPPETPQTTFREDEDSIRDLAYKRVMKLLRSNKEIPPGQLLSFVSKIGFVTETVKDDKTQIKQQNIFAILPGLPEERQKQLLDAFEKELTTARKELNAGG